MLEFPSTVLPALSSYLLWCHGKTTFNTAQRLLDIDKLECGPVPHVMVALPNVRGTLCSTPQSSADAHYWSAVQYRCQDAKPVEICRVTQTPEPILAVSGLKFTIL